MLQIPRGSNIKSSSYAIYALQSTDHNSGQKKGNLLTLKHRSSWVLVTEHHESLSFSSTLEIHIT